MRSNSPPPTTPRAPRPALVYNAAAVGCRDSGKNFIPTPSFAGCRLVDNRFEVALPNRLGNRRNDDVGITVGLTSNFEASQSGRTLTMNPGDAVVLTGAEPASLTAPTCGEYIHLRVPKRSLSPLVACLDAAYGRRSPARNIALRLMTRYVSILDDGEALATCSLRRQIVAHLYDLMAVAIGATEDAAESAANRGARAACLWAIKQDVANHLDEPGLSVATVAARHELMPRYVQRLFEREGTTFTAYLLEQRLAQAYRALIDPRYSGRKISAIAFDSGFGDLSYFNRTFRRQYRLGAIRRACRDGSALPASCEDSVVSHRS